MSQRRLLSLATIILALLFLGACTTTEPDPDPDPEPEPEPETQTYDIQVHDPDNVNPFALAFLMASPTGLSTFSLETPSREARSSGDFSSASLSEIQDGVFVGQVADVDASGEATFSLPAAEDLPNAVMEPVEQAFENVNRTADCEVQAEPSSAFLSLTFFQEVSLPGPVGISLSIAFAVASTEEVNPNTYSTDGALVYAWIYSDSDVSVAFEGTGCGFLAADVDLVEGWNTLMWDYDPNASSLTLMNVDDPELVHFTVAGP